MQHISKDLEHSPKNTLIRKTYSSIIDGAQITQTSENVGCECENCRKEFDGSKLTYRKGNLEPKIFIDRLCPQCVLSKKTSDEEAERSVQAKIKAQKRITTLGWLGVTDLNNTFDKMRHPAGFDDVFNAFKDLAEGKASYYMLMVYGGTGNGKSKCCEATVMVLYDRGFYSDRHRWSDIVRHLKELMKQGGYEEYFNGLRSNIHLIIDDVGSGSTGGSWEWGELEDIVDYRSEHGLFTILTSNLNIKQIRNEQVIPERIISRFRDKRKARLILNKVPDQRPLEE